MSGTPTDTRQRKRALRADLRRIRRALDSDARKAADKRICDRIARIPAFRRATDVATFLAFDGEPSLQGLHTRDHGTRKRFHVPVIHASRMRFAPLRVHSPLHRNTFGISEPDSRARTRTQSLDVVLVSLVGFDVDGYRLGMGGGYYDRYFDFVHTRRNYVRPRLIGVAYEFQRVELVPRDAWDVPLWGIVTDRRFYECHRSPAR